jgi:hypothetical protein
LLNDQARHDKGGFRHTGVANGIGGMFVTFEAPGSKAEFGNQHGWAWLSGVLMQAADAVGSVLACANAAPASWQPTVTKQTAKPCMPESRV